MSVAPGVTKTVLKPGNGTDFPEPGQEVSMEYTGWLYDPKKPDNKGSQFDSSVGRGDLKTPIGVGRVIKGWDEGILGNDKVARMSLGEKATLTISSEYGYGNRGFPGHIPPNSPLIFDVELKGINGKSA
ncbi:peptidyl-prolyl cis-trans isomerase [Delitschia confertaspora ATCC 74209]|uniref:peptidylprolyl isomerase n=1 Tax=Delitschia confertaspora ATCC 74209 TaxID=1513339 RepID=A0A9P4JNM3_9PLEO|nr:peptidyl-prolyl cis-trans isomerase [Delitschia confertaspora ATCC 74209]